MKNIGFSGELLPVIIALAAILYLAYSIFIFKKNRSGIYSFLLWSISWLGIFLLLFKPSHSIDLNFSSAVITQNQSFLGDTLKSIKQYQTINDFLASDAHHFTDTLYILDQIITDADFNKLKHIKVIYLPSDKIGIFEIKHTKAFEASPFEIKGISTPKMVSSIDILFSGNKLATFSPDKDGRFSTEIKINTPGDYLLDVSAITDSDTISEQLPINVHSKPKLSFLILNPYPSFESNYLKNYLAESGQKVAVRNQVSQNKFVTSFSNMERININRVSSSMLNSFDVIVISMDYWNNIGSTVRNEILDVVYSTGKALILIPSPSTKQAKKLPYHEVSDDYTVVFNDGPLRFPMSFYTINTNENWKNVTYQNTKVAAVSIYGIGAISLVGASESYPLLLSGGKKVYDSMWARILSDLVGVYSNKAALILPEMMWEGNLEHFFLLNTQDEQVKLKLNQSSFLPLAYIPFSPNVASAAFYPTQGWNQIQLEDQTKVQNFYIHSDDSWPMVRRNQAQLIAHKHNMRGPTAPPLKNLAKKEIFYVWGLLLFLLGMGGLWLKERLGIN